MELMELYQQIKNPIDDPKVIEKLINAYANIPNGYDGYYTQLLSTVQKEHNNGQYYTADADKFYSMLFNKWKNNIIALNSEEFRKLYSQGSYGQDFIEMRNYLKSVPDVTTMNEADAILSGNTNNKDINNAIRKYSWKALGEDSDWIHVCSKYLTAQKEDYPNVEHRLYLDTESLDTYKMAELFVEKCDQHKLPYYFKFDELANRDDTIVIYSSTENLTKYVEILKEIQKEHPELVSRLKEPPVLAGRIDGWIGYGSEPQKTPDGKPQSFNKTRAKILENAIGNTTKQWIMDHRMMLVTYQGQELSFQDYIAMKGTEKLISSLEHKYNYWEKDGSFNPTMISNMLGYTLQDIKSSQFKKNVYEVLKSSISSSLSTVCNGNAKDMEFINMGVRNGKKIHFTGYDLEKTIQEVSVIISKIDSNFIPTIQSEIKNSAKQYGIDSEKFCFDIKSKEGMMEVATQLDNQNISVPINDNKEKTILTNDSTNPNANLGSSGEDYYEMIDRIKSLGSLKNILKNENLVMAIIAYNGDRHFFAAFIDLINEGLAKHEISSDDLEVFTSGKVADAIVNINETAKQYGNRNAYPNESQDKLNYLSEITDSKAYAASFTHPEILNAMAGNGNTELTEWSRKTTKPPVGGFATVISEMLARGNVEQAKNFIDRVCYYEKEYSLAKHVNNRKEQTDFEQHLVTTQNKLSNKTGNIRITKVNLHKMKESLTTTKSEQRMNGTKK